MPGRRLETYGTAGATRLPERWLGKRRGKGAWMWSEKEAPESHWVSGGGTHPQVAGWRRCHAAGRGSEPRPAKQDDRHQHRSSRFDPPASCMSWRAGIPYQCFKVPASPPFHNGSGIDLPARAVAVRGLNSRQINHLQLYASEAHYRGRSAACKARGETGDGR